MVEEVCPYCEATVGADDDFCGRCGEALTAYDDELEDGYDYDYPDTDREIEADTADGDDEALVYRPRAAEERREELKLLAAVLGVTLVVGALLGWALGWWGRGGDGDDVAADGVGAGEARAVELAESGSDLPAAEPVGLDRLDGLAIAFRDAAGVHVLYADGREPIDLAAAPRAVELRGGSVAVDGDDLFYVAGAEIRRRSLDTEADEAIANGDWVAAVPGESGQIWIVDRREDDEIGSVNVLLRTDRTGASTGEVVLPAQTRLDGATSRGVIVADLSTGARRVIGLDGFEAAIVPTEASDGVVSPDGQWVVRAEPGRIVARPGAGTPADQFDVLLVPSEPAVPVSFVVVSVAD